MAKRWVEGNLVAPRPPQRPPGPPRRTMKSPGLTTAASPTAVRAHLSPPSFRRTAMVASLSRSTTNDSCCSLAKTTAWRSLSVRSRPSSSSDVRLTSPQVPLFSHTRARRPLLPPGGAATSTRAGRMYACGPFLPSRQRSCVQGPRLAGAQTFILFIFLYIYRTLYRVGGRSVSVHFFPIHRLLVPSS